MIWLRRMGMVVGILTLAYVAFADHGGHAPRFRENPPFDRARNERGSGNAEAGVLAEKAARAKAFVSSHGFNQDFCFLVDMHLPSGKNRFFVYDLHKDSILLSGMVAHGGGGDLFAATPRFSNLNGSNCTALGRYRIGHPYQGRFGMAYKLYGLDTTNDQAFARNIVLHSYWLVPEKETWPVPICNSRGCPMVSAAFLKNLQPFIDQSRRPVCLWIFD
ncbi:MAG TPA: murein L,D-transpeptidase catalytic domain family protein [Puia sp.]|nr:murein L,D-transpeptidase catalytic domain family protein [Puia sp.]